MTLSTHDPTHCMTLSTHDPTHRMTHCGTHQNPIDREIRKLLSVAHPGGSMLPCFMSGDGCCSHLSSHFRVTLFIDPEKLLLSHF